VGDKYVLRLALPPKGSHQALVMVSVSGR